jgi:protein phosphatase 1G
MGVYLSKPKTDKVFEQGEGKNLKWGAMGMQGNLLNSGWRTKMEDSHIAHTDLPGGNSLFGVFDGHGGAEVALYVKK